MSPVASLQNVENLPRADSVQIAPLRLAECIAVVALSLLLFGWLTWYSEWKYSVDLRVLAWVSDVYPYRESLWDALLDNSVLIWAVLSIEKYVAPAMVLAWFYTAVFVVKLIVLLRMCGPIVTGGFLLLFIFSLDINQARLSLGMVLMTLAVFSFDGARARSLLMAGVAAMIHLPGAVFMAGFLLTIRRPKAALVVGALVGALGVAVFSNLELPLVRYADLLDNRGFEGRAYFFVIAGAVLFALRRNIGSATFLLACTCVVVAGLSSHLFNLSGRLSELTAAGTIIAAFGSRNPAWIQQRRTGEYTVLAIGLVFFLYRAYQWIWLGNYPVSLEGL